MSPKVGCRLCDVIFGVYFSVKDVFGMAWIKLAFSPWILLRLMLLFDWIVFAFTSVLLAFHLGVFWVYNQSCSGEALFSPHRNFLSNSKHKWNLQKDQSFFTTVIFPINPIYSVCFSLYLWLSGSFGHLGSFSVLTEWLMNTFSLKKLALPYHSTELNFLLSLLSFRLLYFGFWNLSFLAFFLDPSYCSMWPILILIRAPQYFGLWIFRPKEDPTQILWLV